MVMDDEDEAWHPQPRSKRRRRDAPRSHEQVSIQVCIIVFSLTSINVKVDSQSGNGVLSAEDSSFIGESEANPLIILSDEETEVRRLVVY